jgi:hypothetical protein
VKAVDPEVLAKNRQPSPRNNVVKKLFHSKNNKPFLYFKIV